MINQVGFNTAATFNQPMVNPMQNKLNIIIPCIRLEESSDSACLTSTASGYFRRGALESEEFDDVIKGIKLIFLNNLKPKILIVGVGKAQEPFSHLAVIRSLLGGKLSESDVDLNCVDLQSKISDENLEKFAYLDVPEPLFAKDSFEQVKNPINGGNGWRVKQDIFDYLKDVFNDSQKTWWNTRIEGFPAIYHENKYDMVSINNVLMYVKTAEEKIQTMKNLHTMLKINGILITDNYGDGYFRVEKPERELMKWIHNEYMQYFKKLAPGIWQKIK